MSINRHGLKKLKTSPLQRACFEETSDTFLTAGVKAKYGDAKGQIESMIFGRRSCLGSGVIDVFTPSADGTQTMVLADHAGGLGAPQVENQYSIVVVDVGVDHDLVPIDIALFDPFPAPPRVLGTPSVHLNGGSAWNNAGAPFAGNLNEGAPFTGTTCTVTVPPPHQRVRLTDLAAADQLVPIGHPDYDSFQPATDVSALNQWQYAPSSPSQMDDTGPSTGSAPSIQSWNYRPSSPSFSAGRFAGELISAPEPEPMDVVSEVVEPAAPSLYTEDGEVNTDLVSWVLSQVSERR